ncbi:MAG TPA: outer membrane lipoprotein carrier protein LolA [bacterium]|nr:outer membrane lipoprotein carrier protein LolA [bacterium]
MRSAIAIIASAAMVAICLSSFASPKKKAASASAPAPDAAEISSIESAYHALSDLTARFVQDTEVAIVERTVTKKGLFRFKKGGKIRIEYDGPGGKVYVSDGSTLWVYIPGDESSTQTFLVNDETVPREALSFMGGFGKLTKEFEISKSPEFPKAPAGATALHLVPRAGKKHYESLDALFGPDRLLSELIVRNTSGNISRYRFTDLKRDSGLPDRLFTLSSGKATPDTLPR